MNEAVKVLVTGGAGYIGAHACKRLAEAGYQPICYDNLSRGHRWAVRWGPFEEGDLLDRARLDEVLKRHRPVAAIHFAALAYVGESMADPGLYYRNNVVGSLILLEALVAAGVEALIFSSTCATYGVPETLPIVETTPQRPINPYGASKLMVERMLADFEAIHGLRGIALRYFNAAGCDPEGELGELHEPETHAIPLLLAAARGEGPPFRVFGNDYPTPDGTCIRDYVHVVDLVEAHLLALQRLLDGASGGAYNLGTGQGVSVAELIAAATRAVGHDIPVEWADRRPGDPPALLADAGLAARELGWRPHCSDLDSILGSAWAWMTEGRRRWTTAAG